jgi:heme/copper-type cytochrome/quinol oxidase subunit 4
MPMDTDAGQRMRAYKYFLGAFIVSVIVTMVAALVVVRDGWTWRAMVAGLAPFVAMALLSAAIVQWKRRGQ